MGQKAERPAAAGDAERQRAATLRVAGALGTVGNWMFSAAVRRRIMAESGLHLSLGDYTLLAQVSLHQPVRLSMLAEVMEVDKSTLTPPAKRLESRGLIDRSIDPADARAQLVTITTAGKRAISRLWKARTEAVTELMAHWDTDDIEHLAEGLAVFADQIKKLGY